MNMDETSDDRELIVQLRDGNQEIIEFIMEKYKYLVLKKARALFLIGGDNDDLIQEGMIGLFKAVRDYEPEKEVSFYHFAQICINRQLYTAIEASNRKKHKPLNSYISLSTELLDNGGISGNLQDVWALQSGNPEELVINKENCRQMKSRIKETLSGYENLVFQHYLSGKDYIEIGQILGKTPKSIDNALQRIRKKIQFLSETS